MISLEQLTEVYGHGDAQTVVLDRLDFSVDAGILLPIDAK
nr:hypothetical protein BJQ95_03765 [Cryobacterium sp. SO1]